MPFEQIFQLKLKLFLVLTFTSWLNRTPAAELGADTRIVALQNVVCVTVVAYHVLIGSRTGDGANTTVSWVGRKTAIYELADWLFANRRPSVAAFAKLTNTFTITDQFVALVAFIGSHAVHGSVGHG